MGSRSDLQTFLEELLGSDKVYFQPPESTKIGYPCIIYARDAMPVKFANNNPYHHVVGYKITVIDKDPDSDIPDKIAMLPTCMFDRHYTSGNLNHDVFTLYY